MNETEHPPAQARKIKVDDIEIDVRYRLVKRPDGETELPHRIFELLLLFVAEPHVLHPRQRLLERIWSGLIVEDANLSQSVWIMRKALGDERKDWIRTVSKKGYVFEPPASREALSEVLQAEVRQAGALESGPLQSKSPQPEPTSPPPVSHRKTWTLAAAAVFLVALAAIGWRYRTADAPSSVRIALIDVNDPGATAESTVPTGLLHAWLEWKLASLPEARLLTPAELALSEERGVATVMLTSGTMPDEPSHVFVQARIDVAGAQRRIQREGAKTQMARLVDDVSNEVMRTLLPARVQQPWPDLQIDPASAKRYVEFRNARQAHRWNDATVLGQDVIRKAPQFGLARYQLAQTFAVLGQLPQALEHVDAAGSLLRPLPEEAVAAMAAYRLGLTPKHDAAAAAYATLAAKTSDRPLFAIQQARALARMGRFADGLAVLDAIPADQLRAPEAAIARLIARAGMQSASGDYSAALASANEAVRLAGATAWQHEQGQTLLLLANTEVAAGDGRRGSQHYEAAARRFEQAGDTFSALHARATGEIHAPFKGALEHLDPWLARARAAGQRQLELNALRGAVFHYYRAGDIGRYRERLQQAVAVAETTRDRWGLAALGVDQLGDAFMRGDYAAVDRRVAQMSAAGQQGELAFWARQFEAIAASDRGQFKQVLAALDRGEQLGRNGRSAASPPLAAAAMLACTRAGILMRQGNSAQARSQFARCADAGGVNALSAGMGIAELDWISGDRDGARRRVRAVQAKLPAVDVTPDRWELSVDLASLLVRMGDEPAASALLNDVLPRLRSAGFRRAEAFAQIASAEAAMVRGDVAEAAASVAAARRIAPHGLWAPRLMQLDVAIARASGDETTAETLLASLDRSAHRRNDQLHQILAHGWMTPRSSGMSCTEAQRRALVASSGFRAANLDWLRPARAAPAGTPAVGPIRPERALSRVD